MTQPVSRNSAPPPGHATDEIHGVDTDLHELRLQIVIDYLHAIGARSVLDLGCGNGDLLVRMAAHRQFDHIVGMDIAADMLAEARGRLAGLDTPERIIDVRHASFLHADMELSGFDVAVMLETIEHVDPGQLDKVERAVFAGHRPQFVIITTPNCEYNVVHGMPHWAVRHPDHRFEWDRARFRRWAIGVAARNGYRPSFVDIGPWHPDFGSSTQMALFGPA